MIELNVFKEASDKKIGLHERCKQIQREILAAASKNFTRQIWCNLFSVPCLLGLSLSFESQLKDYHGLQYGLD